MKNPPPLRFTIPAAWSGQSIKALLYHHFHLSRGQITALKKHNGIFINGQPVFVTHRLTEGEVLTLCITPLQQNFTPEAIPLSIQYEDADLVVINKPSGLLVHPVRFHPTGTLANALTYLWHEQKENASFHPVHRLDKTTSGLVLIAKNPWSHQQLSRQLEQGMINRLYLGICHGAPVRKSGKISAPIKRSAMGIKREVSPDGKPALTRFRRLKSSERGSLLALKIFTGRTHQIRVHLSSLGHPLYGDSLYGGTENFPRPALHATRISFTHPRTGRRITVTANPPPDFSDLLTTIITGDLNKK
ncbi:MAG TPA: RluA family pseudouridine synthase [Bacillota bacterium]